MVFPYCLRDKEDGSAPIPVEEDPTDDLTKDDTQPRDLEHSQDIPLCLYY